eukprot:11181453-Lingulodinium_polyedra.AAC.1
MAFRKRPNMSSGSICSSKMQRSAMLAERRGVTHPPAPAAGPSPLHGAAFGAVEDHCRAAGDPRGRSHP